MTRPQVLQEGCVACGPIWPCVDHYKVDWSPWAQEIVDLCKAERRKATPEEQIVLCAELQNLAENALRSLGLEPLA